MGRKRERTHYEQLKGKWIARHQDLQKGFFAKHQQSFEWLAHNTRQFAAGSLGGLMLLTAPAQTLMPLAQADIPSFQSKQSNGIDAKSALLIDLAGKLPDTVQPLTSQQEVAITDTLSKEFGFRVTAEFQGKRLDRNYGLIGAEQHLARFPGDTMGTHFENPDDAKTYWSSGMAPGLGAWGYFAHSAAEFTGKDKEREKYYIAVQTFLSPGYNEHVREYSDFFKYQKMLIVNPNNGSAMVVVIGDAGPAVWTGKHLGGSPEVMHYLERVDGAQRGPVLYFFIDDPNDTIPLGLINVK